MFGVLLVHSLGSTNLEFAEFKEHLKEQGFRTSTLLLPGHGTSSSELEFINFNTWIDACESALKDLKCQGKFVVGQGTGASIVLTLAASHPEILGIVTLAGIMSHLKWEDVLSSILKVPSPMFPLASKDNPYIDNNPEIWKKANLYQKIPFKSLHETNYLITKSRKLLKIIQQPIYVLHPKSSNAVCKTNAEIIYNSVSSQKKKLLFIEEGGVLMTLDISRYIVFKEVTDFFLSCIHFYQM